MNNNFRVGHQFLSAQALRLPVIIAALAAAPLALADTTAQSTEVDVNQPAPNVQVQQPAPNVSVETRKPEVDVRVNEPEVSIEQSQPEVAIDQPEPEVKIQQAEPEVVVNGAEPTVEVVEEEPEVEIIKADPDIKVVRQNAEGENKLSEVEQQAQQTLMGSQLSELKGKKIVNANGDEIGDVNKVVTRKSDNAIGFIVPVGGLLGIGATDVFIPASETQLTGEHLQWSQAANEDAIKQQQKIREENFETVSEDHETLDDAYDASLVSQ